MGDVTFRAGDLVVWGGSPAEVVGEHGAAVRLRLAGGGDAVVPLLALVRANCGDGARKRRRTSLLAAEPGP